MTVSSSLPARARKRVALVLLAFVLAAFVPMILGSARAHAASSSITEYISRAGDQVVTVPNGTYSGGTVTAPHAATSGPYKGWLVLVAQSRGGVVVDLTSDHLTLEAGTSRVLFVGFKFINGTVTVRADDVAFWYTEHTFPIEEWNRQYQLAGGNRNALLSMENPLPKTIWIGESSNRTVQRTQILGSDVHDVGDDGVFVDHSQGASIVGSRIWNVLEKSYDPMINPWINTMGDLFHNDAVQIPGGVGDFTLADSHIGTTMNMGGDNASSSNLTLNNLWIANSVDFGFLNSVQNSNRLTGVMKNVRAWGNGIAHPNDTGWDHLRLDMNETNMATWPASLNDSRLAIADGGGNADNSVPAGIAMNGRQMVDYWQALNHTQNPANQWRAAHPYTSWNTYFGFTGAGAPTTPTTPTAPTAPAAPAAAADLVVQSVSWTPVSPKAGDEVTFTAVVKNTGTAPTPTNAVYGVAFFVDVTDMAPTWANNEPGSLAPGQTLTLTANGGIAKNTWTATAGAHNVTAWVDDENHVPGEADETNNKLTAPLTVATATTVTPPTTTTPPPTTITTPPPATITTPPPTTTAPAGELIHRINAGGAALAATPLRWAADTATTPSGRSNAVKADSQTYATTATIDMSHPSIPAGTPMAAMQTQRFDPATGAEMQWAFPKAKGTYQVRLYFAETYAGTAKVGGRVFNVNVEGQQLNNFDIYAATGALNKAIAKTFTVKVTDGTLNINFGHVIENPAIQGIEIIQVS